MVLRWIAYVAREPRRVPSTATTLAKIAATRVANQVGARPCGLWRKVSRVEDRSGHGGLVEAVGEEMDEVGVTEREPVEPRRLRGDGQMLC
ncbi:hypothetical protein GCM10007979_14720 [Nocardioides albus]|nr:hypothetical protein GCM10007979_14720 [Nocardioides albus]